MYNHLGAQKLSLNKIGVNENDLAEIETIVKVWIHKAISVW